MSGSRVIGLSHLYGECLDLQKTTKFWKAQGLQFQEFDLPVTNEKSRLYLSAPAERSLLRYFKTQGPGFEFLEHQPRRDLSLNSKPLISTYFSGIAASTLEDPDRNLITYDPSLKVPVTLVIRVASASLATDLFTRLEFDSSQINADEAVLLELSESAPTFQLQSRLFPQMNCRMVLKEDSTLVNLPKIDHLGLSGLSFIVRSLDEIEKSISLKAHQEFEDPLSQKRVAFNNEFGVMVEFLEIVKRKSI